MTDQQAIEFYEKLKDNIPMFLQAAAIYGGKQVLETNADSMKIKTEATLEGKRYEITTIYKLKEVKSKNN